MQLLMISHRALQDPDSEIFRPFSLRWNFTFDQANFYIRCYDQTEHAITCKKITKARLLEIYKGHLRLLEYENNWPSTQTIRCYQFAQKQNKAILRAILHRTNCTRLRLLAGRPACKAVCCCNCPETRPELECLQKAKRTDK